MVAKLRELKRSQAYRRLRPRLTCGCAMDHWTDGESWFVAFEMSSEHDEVFAPSGFGGYVLFVLRDLRVVAVRSIQPSGGSWNATDELT